MRVSIRRFAMTGLTVGLTSGLMAGPMVPPAEAASAKYYFRVGEVKALPDTDPALKAYAAEAVKAELASRPLWASDIGVKEGEEAIVAELKKRGLRGFDVTVRLEGITKEAKEPKPGGRLRRLAVGVRLSVFGTAIPGAKLSFSGDGEASLETEVVSNRIDTEAPSMAKEAIKDAIKQAVDQAELKLSLGQSAPLNENKRKKAK